MISRKENYCMIFLRPFLWAIKKLLDHQQSYYPFEGIKKRQKQKRKQQSKSNATKERA